MKLLSAELLESKEFLPGQWLQRYSAPWLAAGAHAGQFVHVRTPDYSGLVLRRPFSINTYDRASGEVTIHFRITGVGTEWMARTQPGERLEMLGPLGMPFERDPRSRHVLLVAGGLGMAGVRSLADEALAAGCTVTILFGAANAQQVYPSSLLPDEVEYVVATDDGSFGHRGYVTELVTEFESWADQCFACGPQPMLAALARLAAGRQARLGVARLGPRPGRGRGAKSTQLGSKQARRRAWLQVSMEQNMGCAVGACLGCVVMGTQGPQRVCREGPVFAAEEIDWEGLAVRPLGAIAGMAGSLVIAVASIVTALAYTGSKGEPYSPLTHWVSELGQLGVSELALVFNIGLIVGGICFAAFILALGITRRTGLAWLYAPIGIAAGVAGMFVGVFPMNNLDLHGIAALAFFNLGWICVGLASLDFVRTRERRFPWWLALIGALTVAAFIVFLVVLAPMLSGSGLAAPDVRPEGFWIAPTLEWAVVIGILAWTFATSLTWWRAERGRR